MPFPNSLQWSEVPSSSSSSSIRIQNQFFDEQLIFEVTQENEEEDEQDKKEKEEEEDNNPLFDNETNELIKKVKNFKKILSGCLSLQFCKIEERERLKTKILELSTTEKIYNQFQEEFTKIITSNNQFDFLLDNKEDERNIFIKNLISLNETNIGLLNEEIKILNQKISFIKETLYYEDDQINKTCAICYDNPVQYCLNPCGHLFCKNCSKKIVNICFFCRKPCNSRIKMMFGVTKI